MGLHQRARGAAQGGTIIFQEGFEAKKSGADASASDSDPETAAGGFYRAAVLDGRRTRKTCSPDFAEGSDFFNQIVSLAQKMDRLIDIQAILKPPHSRGEATNSKPVA